MVSCVLFPCLSGLPAIFQVFFAVLTSFPHVGHFAMIIPVVQCYHMNQHKTLAVNIPKMIKKAFVYDKKYGKTIPFIEKTDTKMLNWRARLWLMVLMFLSSFVV